MPKKTASPGLLFGSPLDPRNNSLNLIRLILALAVLVHHSWPLTGSPDEPVFSGDTLGGWAVSGFFVLSGYLIIGSRLTHGLGDYLVHRIARIMPAFVVCLFAMVSIFGPVGYAVAHGSLSGYFGTATSPLNFFISNLTLKMNHYDIAGTPLNVPYAGAWNGSLWSLYYEFLCYLIVAVIGCLAVFRRSPWAVTLLFCASVVAQANIEWINKYTNDNFDVVLLLKLLPFFLGGAVVYVWKSRIGLHWLPGILSLLAALLMVSLFPAWGGQAAGALIAYGTLWISTWLPQPKLIAKNDISYGVYIYAFAFQQLLAVFGAYHWGILLFSLAAAALTIPAAMLSWICIERPVMRRVRKGDHRSAPAAQKADAQALPTGGLDTSPGAPMRTH